MELKCTSCSAVLKEQQYDELFQKAELMRTTGRKILCVVWNKKLVRIWLLSKPVFFFGSAYSYLYLWSDDCINVFCSLLLSLLCWTQVTNWWITVSLRKHSPFSRKHINFFKNFWIILVPKLKYAVLI